MVGMYVTGGRITSSRWACWSMPNSINRRWWRRPQSCLVTVKLMIKLWKHCKVTCSVSFACCPSLDAQLTFLENCSRMLKFSGLPGKSNSQTYECAVLPVIVTGTVDSNTTNSEYKIYCTASELMSSTQPFKDVSSFIQSFVHWCIQWFLDSLIANTLGTTCTVSVYCAVHRAIVLLFFFWPRL